MKEVTNLRMFLQEKNDGGAAFVSCEGNVDGAPVSFTVNSLEAVAPIITGDAVDCKANETGPRAYLPKKETGGLILHGVQFTGKNRDVERDGETVTVHGIRFDRIEHIVAAQAPSIQLRRVAARSKASQTAPAVA